MAHTSSQLPDRPRTRPVRTSFTQRLAHGSALHPWRVVVAWGLVLVASVVLIGSLLGSALSSDGSLTNRPESVRADEALSGSFPQGDRVDEAVVIRSRQLSAKDPEFRGFVAAVRSSLQDTGATASVGDPYAAGGSSGVSDDGHAVAVTVALGVDPEAMINDVVDEVVAADADPSFDVAIAGTYTLGRDFNELSASDLQKGELQFGLPAALIVLLLVFGAVVAATLPMTISLISIIVAVAASAVIGQITPLSFFIVNMITAMGLALGIDYSLFVLSRYREERAAGRDKLDAIVATGGTGSKAVLFSGTSFVVALLGLLLVPDNILRSLSLGAIIVGLITMAAALTLLPALLSLLGDRVNALRLPVVGRDHPAESPFWTRAVRAVVRHPGVALAAGILVLLAATSPVLGLHTGTSGVGSLPDSSLAKAGALALEQSFPDQSSDPAQVVISGDVESPAVAGRIAALEKSVADRAGFGTPQLQIAPAGDVALLSVPLLGDPDGTRARQGLERLRSDLIPAAFDGTGTVALVGGTTAENVDYSNEINHWLPIVLAFVLGLSFILLTLVFRSLVLSVTAVILNLLSVGAAYGLLVLVFQQGVGVDLLGFQQVDRVEAWVPVFLFSVLFALSMDYHVFLLTRIRERYGHSGDTVDAVVHGIAATGRIITGAALIIVVVFAGFAAGQLVMFQQMGFGVGVALLVDATLIRMVIVPAVMTLLGRWNWYLPGWLNWLPELHVEGDPPPRTEPTPENPPTVPASV
jgi:RND superfamily putative drug exporter